MVSFSVQASRSRLPFRYRRRIAYRNSKIRLAVSTYPNFERWWFLGFDVCIEWGHALQVGIEPWSYGRAKKETAP